MNSGASSLFGYKVLIQRDLPKMTVSEDCPISDEQRAKTNLWMLGFFGTVNQMKDGEIFVSEMLHQLHMNPRTYETFKEKLRAAGVVTT